MTEAISHGYLAECLHYEPMTGVLTWKHRPEQHFQSIAAFKRFEQYRAQREAGAAHHGYLRFGLTVAGICHCVYAHRAAWCLMTGNWPSETVDHRDGCRSNNVWANLRHASRQQNNRNTPVRAHNGSGIKGVQKTKFCRFVARMTVDGKSVHVGTFHTATEAQHAYAARAALVHGKFLHSSIQKGLEA